MKELTVLFIYEKLFEQYQLLNMPHKTVDISKAPTGFRIDSAYIQWMVQRYPEQFRNISMSLLCPETDQLDLLLAHCVKVRDRIFQQVRGNTTTNG
jgi:hypothetical protein